MDRHTLFLMQAGLLIFLAGVVLLAFRSGRRARQERGAYWFAAALFTSGVGLALQAERGVLSPVWTILLGNGLFMLFGPLANRSIALTTRQRARGFYLLIALDLATVVNYAYYTFLQPNALVRVVEAVGVMCVMYSSLVVLLLRAKEPVIKPALRSMAGLFCLHMVLNVLRVTLAVRLRSADSFFSWFGIVTIAGVALSYLWIEMLRLEDRLEQTAMTDPLTGLMNRRALDILAARELQRAGRSGLPCSALMIDVDRFKQINDRLGHAAGDTSLCAVGAALTSSLRGSDIAARLGGDEFFVLLPDADEKIANVVVARIRNTIDELQLETVDGESFSVAVSIGQVTNRGAQMTLDDLLHSSDIMLYREKQISRAQHGNAAVLQGAAGGAQVQPSNA